MPGLLMIKTSDKGLIERICQSSNPVIPAKHISGSLIPKSKVYFFEVSDDFIKKLSDDEKKLITITKQAEIDELVKIPQPEHPVKRFGDDILVAELEKRGYSVEKDK